MPTLPPTEQRHPLSLLLDSLSTIEMVRLMNYLDAQVPQVVAEALPEIAQTIELITATLAGAFFIKALARVGV